jgi:hypothetical protein
MTTTRVGRIPIGEGGIGQTGGFIEYREFLATIDLANALTATASSQSLAVTGLLIGDIPMFINAAEGLTTGIALVALGPVLANNVLVTRIVNPTVAGVDAASASFVVGVLRPL